MEALVEDENAMDKGVADTVKNHKRQHDDEDDDEDPSARPNQGKKTKRRRTKESESSMKSSTTKETSKGKASSKSSKTGKSATTQEPIKEPIAEVVMDDLETNANEDVVNDADRPQDYVAPKTNKLSKDTWFNQPPRPPTPDPEWNKRQVVTAQPKQPWFNHMDSAANDPLTFDELMATPIDFSKSLIIKRRVKDLQLGVESNYQKKINITKPQKTFPGIEFKELYTPSYKPPRTVCDELHYKILDFRLGYNKDMSRRKWSATDKRRSELMVELIDKQMRERMIIRNLERLVGARELEMDYKLMTRTE
ncbi:hypothetical protein Tco_1219687 [Tanacetum coccineum]